MQRTAERRSVKFLTGATPGRLFQINTSRPPGQLAARAEVLVFAAEGAVKQRQFAYDRQMFPPDLPPEVREQFGYRHVAYARRQSALRPLLEAKLVSLEGK